MGHWSCSMSAWDDVSFLERNLGGQYAMGLDSQSCLQPPKGPRMGQRVGIGTILWCARE